jgi:hypothetical protein
VRYQRCQFENGEYDEESLFRAIDVRNKDVFISLIEQHEFDVNSAQKNVS